ncbi:hypothetical protein M9H77_03567 [Catharanthus roseus]|uniref:Uncharacterized protein n=1 Tax=Catharanthus roseus TaxID=4058 RepID=A0ACC0CBM0_CATRO|nr:hypothetical protein M9H77_03567 [Catharanthus roseus]
MLYLDVEEDDEDNDDADQDYDVSSASIDDNNPNDEEYDISTLVNPLSPTTVNQWQSNIGLGEQIDDLINSSTIRLLNWNDAMTDLQLGMRFLDKIKAISIVQKWSIRIGREFRVVKIYPNKGENNSWSLGNNQIHQGQHMPCSDRDITSKFISKLISHLVANDPKIPVSNVIQEVQVLLQMGCTYKRTWYA